MLSIFRTNQLLASFLLIFYVLLLHAVVFIIPHNWSPSGAGIFANWIYQYTGARGMLPDILAMVLIFLQAILANFIDLDQKLSREITLFPGLFLILLTSLIPDFLHLSPFHFANLFILLAIQALMGAFRVGNCADRIHNAGLLIGLAGMFVPGYWVFLFLAFFALSSLRSFSFRERLMVLSGFFTVYFLAAVYHFWYDRFDLFYQTQIRGVVAFLDFARGGDLTLVYLFFPGIFLLFVLATQNQLMLKQIMQTQKRINLYYWALLTGALFILVQPHVRVEYTLVIAPALGILTGMRFAAIRPNIAELIHLLILLVVLFFQYRLFLFPS